MELRLLGSLEVWVDGEARPVPVRAERALLAMLALSPSRVVPTTTLIDALWPSAESAHDPINALQLRVSRLRRTLASIGAPARLLRDGAGYRLVVDAEAVDLHRFDTLIDGARRAEAPDVAVSRYDDALRLWRGEPLVDFAGEAWAAVEATRLTELRLSAVAERAERMIALGRYDEAVADLEPLASAGPTRERLVGQLMIALCLAGRQAEALAVFSRTRRALVDELGLDPSPELRALAERVLRQDPALAPSATSAAGGRPRQESGDRAPAGNLPLRATSFVGRDAEVARTLDALTGARLVTLAGPAGAGKTSLAVEVARAAAARFAGGAWLVRLAAVGDGELLAHTVADALEVSVAGSASDPEDALVGHLATWDLLVLLDNCEHLIEAVASFAETVLGRCAGVRILATSREALAVPGEVQLPVAPLAVPDELTPAGRVPEFAAARLFLDRAAAAMPELVFDDAALQAVGLICQRLDGIPLALELAAARLASLSPLELADRVHDRFATLTSGSRTADARQRTLRKAVDWSHDLLAPAEKVLLRRLAVFRGGWTLAAAEDVVTDDALPEAAVLDVLERLVKQSLVIADHGGGVTRYRMLETLRQYAAERLQAAAEGDLLAAAHAAHYLQLGELAEVGLRGRAQERWLAMLREEHANLRAALAWFGSVPEQVDGALRLAGSLGLYWHLGRHLEGRETLARVTALPGGSPEARARALQAVSLAERPTACIVHPSPRCAAAASASLEIFEQVDDQPRAAFSRLLLAVEGVAASPDVDAGALLDEASRQFVALGDDWGLAVVAFVRMEILAKRGDEASMRRAAEEAIARFQALSDGWGLSAVLYHLGWGLQRFNRLADAVPVLEEAIEVAARAGVYNTEQWATADLGLVMLLLGREEEASAWFARAGDVSDQVGDRAGRVFATYGRAVLAQRLGDHGQALSLFEEALLGLERLGIGLASGLAVAGVGQCEEALGNMAAARAAYQRALALGQGAGEVGLTAAALEGLARGLLADSDPVGAAELLGRARWLRDTYHRPATEAESAAVDAASATARAALDEQVFAAASRAGAAVGLRGAG